MAKTNGSENHSVNLLGAGTVIKGDIESDGDFRIDGKLQGSIVSKGKIVIGTTGHVEGEVTCQNADVSGNIKANVRVKELLSLKASAFIHGDIVTGKLSIEPGAKFTGSCDMGENTAQGNTVPLRNGKTGRKEKTA